jgi:hypothetical protein
MRALSFLPETPEEWIIPKEGLIACSIVENVKRASHFLEIGVLNGAYSLNILRNVNIEGVGIDPFPNLSNMKQRTLKRLEPFNFEIYETKIQVFKSDFSLVNIDGLHTYKAVLEDLEYSSTVLSNDGVIRIDDIWHPYFPGVSAAFGYWIVNSQFACFLITGSAAYICRSESYDYWYNHFETEFLKFPDFPFSHFYGEGNSLAYVSDPTIGKYKPLLSIEKFAPSNKSKLLPKWPIQPVLSGANVFQNPD